MILGVGTDIVENRRVAGLFKRRGRQFLDRIYSTDEIDYCLSHLDPVPYLAARFAAKEAAVKALNIRGRIGLLYSDIEVAGKIYGKKNLLIKGKAGLIAEGMGVRHHHLSLSHTHELSTAVVILEG